MVSENKSNQIYPINHFIFKYIESIYKVANSIKNIIEYTIGKGNTGLTDCTGEKEWV